MGEEEECKPMFQKDGMVGSGSPTLELLCRSTLKSSVNVDASPKRVLWHPCSGHRSFFVSEIVSGKYPKETLSNIKMFFFIVGVREVLFERSGFYLTKLNLFKKQILFYSFL